MTRQEEAAYHELCGYTLSHPDRSLFIHQYVVDAFAAQHADQNTKPVTLTFALVGLYLCCDRKYSGRNVQRVHMLLANRRKNWPKFAQPEKRGDVSVLDVLQAPPGAERDSAIRAWCASVWQAYHDAHQAVADLLRAELG